MQLANTLTIWAHRVAPYSSIIIPLFALSLALVVYCWWPVFSDGNPRHPVLMGLSSYVLLITIGLNQLIKNFGDKKTQQHHSFAEKYAAVFLLLWFSFLLVTPFYVGFALLQGS